MRGTTIAFVFVVCCVLAFVQPPPAEALAFFVIHFALSLLIARGLASIFRGTL